MNLATNNQYITTKYTPIGLLIEGQFLLCKVKGKDKVRFTLEKTLKTQRGSRGIFLHFNLGARLVVKATPRPHYPNKTTTVRIVQVTGRAN